MFPQFEMNLCTVHVTWGIPENIPHRPDWKVWKLRHQDFENLIENIYRTHQYLGRAIQTLHTGPQRKLEVDLLPLSDILHRAEMPAVRGVCIFPGMTHWTRWISTLSCCKVCNNYMIIWIRKLQSFEQRLFPDGS